MIARLKLAFALLLSLAAAPIAAQSQDAGTALAIQARNLAASKPSVLDSRPTIYNFSPVFLSKYRLKVAQAAVDPTVRVKVVHDGNSLDVGAGAGTGSIQTDGARAKSLPAYLRSLLSNATGVAVREDNLLGVYNAAGTAVSVVAAYDPRVSFAGSTWSSSIPTFAGAGFLASTGSDPLTFTPSNAADKCDIWYIQTAGLGSFTITDSSGTLATVNAAGADALPKITVTRAASTNPISIQRTTGGAIRIAGIDCYNTTVPTITLANMGYWGVQATQKAAGGSPWDHPQALALYAPDLTIFNLVTNGVRQNIPAATYTTTMQLLISKAKLSGDCIIIFPHPDNTTLTNPALVPQYWAATLALGRANGCPVINFSERFGSYANASLFYYDTVHLLASGYRDEAMAILPLLVP